MEEPSCSFTWWDGGIKDRRRCKIRAKWIINNYHSPNLQEISCGVHAPESKYPYRKPIFPKQLKGENHANLQNRT